MLDDLEAPVSLEKGTDPGDRLWRLEEVTWPTVVVGVLIVSIWGSAVTLGAMGRIPLIVAAVVASLAAFAAFTPMHEAVHRSVSRRGWINAVVGRICAVPLMAPFPAFRQLHLEHHRDTNDEDLDPDRWSLRGPAWTLPFRWATQDLHYVVRYARAGRSRPGLERVETWSTWIGLYGLAAALAIAFDPLLVVALWLVPARIGIALLAFSFDYLPHTGLEALGRDDPVRATAVLLEPWLTPLFLYQNYHLVHHLYPALPFYRYARVWRRRERELRARGAPVRRLRGSDLVPGCDRGSEAVLGDGERLDEGERLDPHLGR